MYKSHIWPDVHTYVYSDIQYVYMYILRTVDKGLRGRNVLQSLLLNLLRICSRSVRPMSHDTLSPAGIDLCSPSSGVFIATTAPLVALWVATVTVFGIVTAVLCSKIHKLKQKGNLTIM